MTKLNNMNESMIFTCSLVCQWLTDTDHSMILRRDGRIVRGLKVMEWLHITPHVALHLQWQHEDVLSPNNQPLSVSVPPRSVILSNMKKKLYKLSQDEGAIIGIQVSVRSTSLRHQI